MGGERFPPIVLFCHERILMNILKQIFIILFLSFLGELLHWLLPLPIPASIYGLVLMLLCLCTHIVKPEDVKDVGMYLVEVMTVFFIPITVQLVDSWADIRAMLVPAVLAITVSTLVVMAVSGLLTQAVVSRKGGRKDD